jgi:hypothetical protein
MAVRQGAFTGDSHPPRNTTLRPGRPPYGADCSEVAYDAGGNQTGRKNFGGWERRVKPMATAPAPRPSPRCWACTVAGLDARSGGGGDCSWPKRETHDGRRPPSHEVHTRWKRSEWRPVRGDCIIEGSRPARAARPVIAIHIPGPVWAVE